MGAWGWTLLVGICVCAVLACLALAACAVAGRIDREENEDAWDLLTLQSRLSDVSGGDAVSTPSSRATSQAGRESVRVPPPELASTPQRSEPRRRPDSERPRPASSQ